MRAPLDGAGQRVVAPVTNRGDTIGVLELTLPDGTDELLAQVADAAHALAYIVVTDRRFTDLYHWGKRTTPLTLAAEIQRGLLPSAASCEADEFTVAAALVPADSVGGDTYDYTVDRDTLHLSITDAMGHDVESALLATVLVNASRRARRAGHDLAEQALEMHTALREHGSHGHATGQLLRIAVDGTGCRLVNAGHPGHCDCVTAPWRNSTCGSTSPSASPPRRPSASRTSICDPATGWCSTPTACRSARPAAWTWPPCCVTPPPSTPAKWSR